MKLYTANNGDIELQEEEVKKQKPATKLPQAMKTCKPTVTEAKSNYTCQLHQGELKRQEKTEQEASKTPQPAEVE